MGAKGRQKRGADRGTGLQRLGLIVFGALFVLLFIGFAIAQGISGPSVPSGDVAIVQDVPSGDVEISEAEFQKGFQRQLKGGKPPKPGEAKYKELQESVLAELLDAIWIKGQAEEFGVSVTPKQIETELANIKKQNFPTKSAWQSFLKESGFTPEEVNERVEIQLLSTRLQEAITNEGPKVSQEEIDLYYEENKATQFTTPASRDLRLIINEDKTKVDQAKSELEKDHSPAGWKKAAKKYSSDPNTNSKGGLQPGITEEFVQGPLKQAIFGSATGELVGPVKSEKNYILLEVVKLNPKKVQSQGEAESQIKQTLTQERQQEHFSEFLNGYQAKWQSRTVCGSEYRFQRCANYGGNARPVSNFACEEDHPKVPPTACPAPVVLPSPAMPGTVTVLNRKGEQFPQRPYPEKAGGEAAEAGALAPPTGE